MAKDGERLARSVTGIDVAKAAGVSQSVVSLVFSGKAGTRVSAKTERRVREAARKLDYAPNVTASVLKTGKVSTLALAVPVITQPFFSAVLQAAEVRARALGYTMTLLSSLDQGKWSQRLIDSLRGNQFAGAIVYGPSYEDTTLLKAADVNVVACELNNTELPTIDLDLAPGMRQAAEHLLEAGHRRIGYLGTENPHITYRIRREAFFAAFEEGGGVIAAVETSPAAEFEPAVAAAAALIHGAGDITAIMCDDDLLAPAVIRAAHAVGLSTPGDISVVGVGDLEISRMLTPPLTTVALSSNALGTYAVDELVHVINGEVATRRILPTHLVIRETVTSPATRPTPSA